MKIRIILPAALLGWSICIWGSPAFSDELKRIRLMPMQLDTGRPLMHVLKERKSTRAFLPKKLPIRVLSNLLWAANGINRPGSEGRTAPSARNQQEIDIYVATAEGLYLYDARVRQLLPVLREDIRGRTGQQAYVGEAPVNLIYVADYAKMAKTSAEDRDLYAAADAGFISQNVYLYCASEGLATVVRGTIDRNALSGVMKLRSDQKIILAQSVGYPRK